MNADDCHPAASTARAARATCAVCLRPSMTCICQWIRPVAHEVEVLILQHPMEVAEAKGSARLLHLSLPNSRLVVGEVFDEAAVSAMLAVPKRNLLLYPETPSVDGAAQREPPSQAERRQLASLRLVVIDGTWRKSRKMLHLNPWLQGLPRLPLDDVPASRYQIRKAHAAGQLSTLEATCAALMQLRGDGRVEASADKFRPLLEAFDGFVAQRQALRRDMLSRRGL